MRIKQADAEFFRDKADLLDELIMAQHENLDEERQGQLAPLMECCSTIDDYERLIDELFKSPWRVDFDRYEKEFGAEAATKRLRREQETGVWHRHYN
jgi:hypothetical protein